MLQLALRRRHARQAACGSGWTEEGRRHRGAQRLGTAALVEAGGMAERGRLEALRECMMPDVAAPPWPVAVLFGEWESGEQVNCVVSSMHRHDRFTPIANVSPRRSEPPLRASFGHHRRRARQTPVLRPARAYPI
jgi:hypothetical protein